MDKRYQEILETLERQYPGQIYLSVDQFATAAGMARGTVYNRISIKSKNSFPFKVKRFGKKPKIGIHDAARYFAKV
jgi:predicted DNA-binding transcriptional regulator AlpA